MESCRLPTAASTKDQAAALLSFLDPLPDEGMFKTWCPVPYGGLYFVSSKLSVWRIPLPAPLPLSRDGLGDFPPPNEKRDVPVKLVLRYYGRVDGTGVHVKYGAALKWGLPVVVTTWRT